MAKILTVDVPGPMLRELEQIAKRESKRLGKQVTAAKMVTEQVMKQAFQIIKISEDGEQTETDLVAGAEFTVYLIRDLSR